MSPQLRAFLPDCRVHTLGSTVGVATLVGCLSCGRIIEYLRDRRYVDAPLRVGIIAGLVFAVFGSAATLTSSSTLAVVFFAIAGFTGYWAAVTIRAWGELATLAPIT